MNQYMEACRPPQSDDVRMLRLEVSFERPAYMTQEQQHRLLELLGEIVGNPESQPKDGVFWVSGVGAKPIYSKVDAMFLGVPTNPDAPDDGEPSYEDDVYFVDVAARAFRDEKERKKVEAERAQTFKPRTQVFTCHNCGGHEWSTKNLMDPIDQWVRACYGYVSKQVGLARSMVPCGFTWPTQDDQKYGIRMLPEDPAPEMATVVGTALERTRRQWLEHLSNDDFTAVIEMLPTDRRLAIGNQLIEGLGDASFGSWEKLSVERATLSINLRNEQATAAYLRRRYNALPDEPFQNFIERIVDPKYLLKTARVHSCMVTGTTATGAPLPPCRGCQDDAKLAAAKFKPGDQVTFREGDGTPLVVVGMQLDCLGPQYLLQVLDTLCDGPEEELRLVK
jgi:hypothetical protein